MKLLTFFNGINTFTSLILAVAGTVGKLSPKIPTILLYNQNYLNL